ncbi:hypothetical protein [Roseivivax marinus]|uniref:hypothetical protein n=1 Tax=Roseivivax marinus TaxID=1379903 RepID=UPI00273EE429|nr:hypothetical protein [Roseivivax marinus]
MLGATLSKAAVGLIALLAIVGAEKLPMLAGSMPAGAQPLVRPAAPATTQATGPERLALAGAVSRRVTSDALPRQPGLFGSATARCEDGAAEADRARIGDRIALRVFEDAADGAERFERRDLSGTFPVEAGGDIAMPGLGRIAAVGQPLACLEGPVSAALGDEMGLSATVTASFAARPPVLVQGAVIAPGSYDYTPGLTVGAVIAKAGASSGGAADTALRRTLAARRDELRALRAGLVLEHARLSAQRAGAPDLALDSTDRRALTERLGADRIEGEEAVLRAALGSREIRAERDAAARDDLDSALALAIDRRDLMRARLADLTAERDLLEDALGTDCRGRCSSQRTFDELRLDSLNGRLADLELTVQDAETRVIEARQARDRHERVVALDHSEADRTLALSVAEALADRNALDAQIAAVNAQLADLGGAPGDRSVIVERRSGLRTETIAGTPDLPLLPGDLVTVSQNVADASVAGTAQR